MRHGLIALAFVGVVAQQLPSQSCDTPQAYNAHVLAFVNRYDAAQRIAKDPTVTLIPEQVQGSQSGTVAIPAGTPGVMILALVSSVWGTTPGFTVTVTIDRSDDGGVTWNQHDPYPIGFSAFSGALDTGTKGCAPASGGLPCDLFWYDGQAALYRWNLTANQPFSWGANAIY